MGESDIFTIGDQPTQGDTSTEKNPLEITCAEETSETRTGNIKYYEIGSFLGKYMIKSYLGHGGMGVVYRGFDPLVERDIALKVMPPSLSTSPQARQRFLAEARAVGRLIHPNATALYEVGESEGTYFLAMEFVGGGSIASLISEQRLPPERATRYLAELCFGLAAAHDVGLIHRDIKPENLLRTLQDHIKITDFGLAKVQDALSSAAMSLTNPGSMLGTPLYMSPEQFHCAAIDSRSDVYAAGATYYHMLTGKAPYADSPNLIKLMYAHCEGPVPDPRQLVPELPAGCAEIVQRAMAKQPQDRYETADDLAHAAMMLLGELCGPDSVSLSDSHFGHGNSASRLSGSRMRAQPVTIWLVEPSRMQARVLQQNLAELGVAQIRSFETIAQTLDGLSQEVPHAIISAMHLDDGSGDDLADRLRADARSEMIHCFLVSSSATDIGPDSYYPGRPLVLPKPVTKEMLTEVLKRIAVPTGR